MSIGLALSGGGAKGLAHIGVIEALRDNGIEIDYISGSSSGSVIASLYACGYTPNEILALVNRNSKSLIDYDKTMGFKLIRTLISRKVSIAGFVKGNKLEKTLRNAFKTKGIKDISELNMPIAIPTVNLQTGEVVYFTNCKDRIDGKICTNEESHKKLYDDKPSCMTSGDLAEIVRASCSFPGVFTPKGIEEKEYIDGGVRVNTPVKVLKAMGADKVIAVSFDCNNNANVGINNIMGISAQAISIMTHTSNMAEQELADMHIRLCIKNVSLLDFSKSTYLAKRGYNIITRNINYIKKTLGM